MQRFLFFAFFILLAWCALRNPALTGEILTHFSDTELFLTWVHEKSSENEK